MPTFIDTLPASTAEFFAGKEGFEFNDTREGDLGNAWFCAEASALAYKDGAFALSLAPQLETLGWSVQVFNEDPTQVVLLLSKTVAVIAFRGTRVAGFPDLLRKVPIDVQDLTTDFSILLIKYPKQGRVHSGFFGAFEKFWASHGRTILDLTTHRSVFLTGHSLGAAIATVGARDLELVRALYTFGSPRVGDADFEKGFEQIGLPVYRFVHEHDLVTTVPLPEMGYRHVGDMLHIVGGADALKVSRDTQHTLLDALQHNLGALPDNLINGLTGTLKIGHLDVAQFPVPDDALADHAPTNYTTKLKAISDGGRRLPP